MGHPSVVLIGDGSHESTQLYELFSQGWSFCVKAPPISSDLVVTPSMLQGFSTLVLYMSDRFPALTHDLQSAISEFVANGGTLVAFPFAAWSCRHRGNHLLSEVLPVTCERFFENQEISIPSTEDWERSEWGDRMKGRISGELVTVNPDASVEMSVSRDGHSYDLLVSKAFGEGRSLYFNACHHVHSGEPLRLWDSDSRRMLRDGEPKFSARLSRLLSSTIRRTPQRRLMLPELLYRLVYESSQSSGFNPEPSDYLGLDSFAFLDHYTHGAIRSEPVDVLEDLFPSEDDYVSMTRAEKLATCRALAHVMAMISPASQGLQIAGGLPVNYGVHIKGRVQLLQEAISDTMKGELFERFVSYLLRTVPGVSIAGRRMSTRYGEVDLLVRNVSTDPVWSELGSTIPVECKWTRESTSIEQLSHFSRKLQELGASTGILATKTGVSGPADRYATLAMRDASREGVRILALTFRDLLEATCLLNLGDKIQEVSTRQLGIN